MNGDIPQVRQKQWFTSLSPNRYVARFSLPSTSTSEGRKYLEDMTTPFRTQIEQLQRRPVVMSSLVNLKRTEPQWQLAL